MCHCQPVTHWFLRWPTLQPEWNSHPWLPSRPQAPLHGGHCCHIWPLAFPCRFSRASVHVSIIPACPVSQMGRCPSPPQCQNGGHRRRSETGRDFPILLHMEGAHLSLTRCHLIPLSSGGHAAPLGCSAIPADAPQHLVCAIWLVVDLVPASLPGQSSDSQAI